MLDATRIALPRSLDSRGLTLKSKTMSQRPVHAGAGTEHILHRAPLLFQFVFLPVIQALGLGVKPLYRSCPENRALVNVAGFVDQIQHHTVFHCFAEFVGMDIAAKDLHAGLPCLLQQRRAGKADKDCIGHHGLHHAVQLAALGAVAFIDKDKDLAHRAAGLGFQFFEKFFKVIDTPTAKLVHQRTQQAGVAWPVASSVAATAGAGNGFARRR
jgi:hypothetical protein